MTGMSMLVRFNPRNKTFQSINSQIDGQPLAEDQFTYFLRDSKRRLWIGGEKGLSVYTEKDNGLLNTMIIPESSPLNYKSINCIHEARNGIFWIGTRNGIYRFDESKKETRQYTTAHGLPNNVVHGILEDSSGNLWLSTNQGLSCFQPNTENSAIMQTATGFKATSSPTTPIAGQQTDKCISAASTASLCSIRNR